MPKQMREELMKSASERTLRRRWSFFDRVFRSRPDSEENERPAGRRARPDDSLNR